MGEGDLHPSVFICEKLDQICGVFNGFPGVRGLVRTAVTVLVKPQPVTLLRHKAPNFQSDDEGIAGSSKMDLAHDRAIRRGVKYRDCRDRQRDIGVTPFRFGSGERSPIGEHGQDAGENC